jgi:molecular chaperone GrpE (heat shock protein)
MSKQIFQELPGFFKKIQNSLRTADRGAQTSGQETGYTPTNDDFPAEAVNETVTEAVAEAAAKAVAEKEQIQQQRDSLIRECTDLMNDLDRFAGQGDEGANQMVEFVLSRLEDALDRNRVTRIEGESQFNNIRHRTEGGKRVPQGTPIVETVRSGYMLDNRVIRRALVKVEPDSKSA